MTQGIRNRRIVLVILAIAVLITVNVTVWVTFFRNRAPVLAPDHAPQKTEEYAAPVEEEPEEKMQAPQGGGAVSMVYQKSVTIDLNENMAYMMFQNQINIRYTDTQTQCLWGCEHERLSKNV